MTLLSSTFPRAPPYPHLLEIHASAVLTSNSGIRVADLAISRASRGGRITTFNTHGYESVLDFSFLLFLKNKSLFIKL